MKIGDNLKTRTALRAGKAQAAAPTASATSGATSGPAPIVDKIMLAGIPPAELTPRVRDALMTLMGEVQSLRTELKQARERLDGLEKLADSDPMLDILNRRAFVRDLDRSLAMIDRYNMSASLIFVDLNDLKKINDSMGHGAGDAALAHVADVLSVNVRQTDSVARLGGDEFGVLLAQANYDIAMRKADELTTLTAAKPVKWKSGEFHVRISSGVAEIPKGVSAAEAMEKADTAMYEVKRQK